MPHKPVFESVVDGLDDDDDTVAIFSHNPGITTFVNSLTDAIRLDNMPTCAVFAVRNDTKHWKDFRGAGIQFFILRLPQGARPVTGRGLTNR